MITVLVVDDHELVRTGICRMLEDHTDVQVIGQAESGEDAITLVRQHHPNVVLLDVNMPGIGGVETTRRLLTNSTRYQKSSQSVDLLKNPTRLYC